MNREQLEHTLRAASDITGEKVMFVIGSQSILGSFSEDALPARATASAEIDIGFFDDPGGEKADLVEGSIGEYSIFFRTYKCYVDGVDLSTATLPEGWTDRLVDVTNANTNGAVGRCLDPHDCVVSKMVAGRPKDWEFIESLLAASLISSDLLLERLDLTDMHPLSRQRATDYLMRYHPPSWLARS